MLPRELIKSVKHLEIIARRAVNDQLAGRYHSSFKGQGIDFADVREYQPGDDIRVIDWKVSARLDDLYVKQFQEEREMTVVLLVDMSGSQSFGTQEKLKQETAAEIAALIAFSAIKNNDRVGLLTFTDRVEKYIKPKKGRKHVLRVITEILTPGERSKQTNIESALHYLTRVLSKRAVVFVISDFMDEGFSTALRIANRRHEIVPIIVSDPMEYILPNIGLVNFEDPETGERVLIDTSSRKTRNRYETMMAKRTLDIEKMFKRNKIDTIRVETNTDYVQPLMRYFKRRTRRNA